MMTVDSKFSQVQIIEVDPDHDGQRIDNFLMALLKTVPRSRVYRLLRTGEVRVNKGRARPARRLLAGDIVRLPPVVVEQQPVLRVPSAVIERIGASIVSENQEYIVVNKPAGLAVHGGTEVDFGLIDVIRQLYDDQGVHLVHRLDRLTSGVIVLARSRSAANRFQAALRNRKIRKQYRAILCGQLATAVTIKEPLLKITDHNSHRVVISDQGKPALTTIHPGEGAPNCFLAGIEIETGRTHQIRVHAAHRKMPVLGDARYGSWKYNRAAVDAGYRRMYLHALSIELPGVFAYRTTVDAEWLQALEFCNRTIGFD